MKVVVFGAGGIIGQHMMLAVPRGVEAIFSRLTPDHLRRVDGRPLFHPVDLTDLDQLNAVLAQWMPDVIVNLAGESRVDLVEKDPEATLTINVRVPGALGEWCDLHGRHLIHVSSQAVFGGDEPPYGPYSASWPVNKYGHQKRAAELIVYGQTRNWTIARPTFVLGVRPLPTVGRRNPLEEALAEPELRQVGDREFSPLFATSAARSLWELVRRRPLRSIVHLGIPITLSRFQIARSVVTLKGDGTVTPVMHTDFPGIAERPRDTTYAGDAIYHGDYDEELRRCLDQWRSLMSRGIADRAREIAVFLGLTDQEAAGRLAMGFHALHAEVAADFRAAAPASDEALLEWYRRTRAYIWELSAYHVDERFNYAGMCAGIAQHLVTERKPEVLCLGDGIGDLTIACFEKGLNPCYHDLARSKTARFAEFRFWKALGHGVRSRLTEDWNPDLGIEEHDAIVALDFMEHVTDVPAWAKACAQALKPGGIALFQNAFGIGSPDREGSIPCHLARNTKYETEWEPLLSSIGLAKQPSGWWSKRA